MGEIYLDNYERLLIPEWQDEYYHEEYRNQKTKTVEDLQRNQSIPVPGMWATSTQGMADKQKSLLPSA